MHHLESPNQRRSSQSRDRKRYAATEGDFTNPYDPPPELESSHRSIGQSLVHYVQLSLACGAVTLFLAWLALLAWEIKYHQILIEDYMSGFLSWALILVFLRRFIIFAFAKPQNSASPPQSRNT